MGSHESIVTVGMRGDGDKPMTERQPQHCWKVSLTREKFLKK